MFLWEIKLILRKIYFKKIFFVAYKYFMCYVGIGGIVMDNKNINPFDDVSDDRNWRHKSDKLKKYIEAGANVYEGTKNTIWFWFR